MRDERAFAMRKKLTFMDVIKGLLFCFIIILIIGFIGRSVKLIFEDNILNIENPNYAIIGGAFFLIVFCFVVAFSKVPQAGYSKNILVELIKLIKRKS